MLNVLWNTETKKPKRKNGSEFQTMVLFGTKKGYDKVSDCPVKKNTKVLTTGDEMKKS